MQVTHNKEKLVDDDILWVEEIRKMRTCKVKKRIFNLMQGIPKRRKHLRTWNKHFPHAYWPFLQRDGKTNLNVLVIYISTIKFVGFEYQSTNLQETFNRFIKSNYIHFLSTTNRWKGTKNVKDWDILWSHSDITGWNISISNIVSMQ